MKKNKFIPVNTPLLSSFEKKNIQECIKNNQLTNGKFIKKFEKSFAKFHSKKFGISISNGTAALEVAVKSLGLKKGSEVIIPNFSIISTAIAVIKNGLIPIYVDCDINTWNTSPDEIISKFSKKTKAIIITHVYGLPVNLEKVLAFVKKKGVFVIEDTAEVIGLKYKKSYCGSFGDISTFSFYANKHVTSGEGGMILTNSKKFFSKCNSLKNLCFANSYTNRFKHTDLGWNYRMSNIHAAIGEGQFRNIKKIVKLKRKIGNIYFKALKNHNNIILQPNKLSYANNIYWVFGLVLKNKLKNKRDKIMKNLLKIGIETRPFFFPMSHQKILKKYNKFNKYKFSNSLYIAKNGFYLPSGLGLKIKEINKVIYFLKKELN